MKKAMLLWMFGILIVLSSVVYSIPEGISESRTTWVFENGGGVADRIYGFRITPNETALIHGIIQDPSYLASHIGIWYYNNDSVLREEAVSSSAGNFSTPVQVEQGVEYVFGATSQGNPFTQGYESAAGDFPQTLSLGVITASGYCLNWEATGCASGFDTDGNGYQIYGYYTSLVFPQGTVALIEPEDNSHNNSLFQFTYNITGNMDNCSLYTDITGSWSIYHTNYSLLESNNPQSFDLTSLPLDGTYNWGVTCNSTIESINRTFFIDTVSPEITINPSTFFNSSNESTISDYSAVTNLTVNITVTDSTSGVYAFEFNITGPDGVNKFYYNQENLGNLLVFNYTSSVNYSTWETNRNYSIDVWASDPHTAQRIPEYQVTKGSDLRFNTAEGNYIRVYSDSLADWNTEYNGDRYSFDVEFLVKGGGARRIYIQSDHKIQYIKDGKYAAWFVIMNGRNGNWLDFEGAVERPEVIKISDYLYEVRFSNLGDQVHFNSIGGLNVKHETYQWFLPGLPQVYSVNLTTNAGYNPAVVENVMVGLVNGSVGTYPSLVYEYIWYRNGAVYSTGSKTSNNLEYKITNVANLSSNTASIGDSWILSVRANSSTGGLVSSYVNSTALTFIDWNLTLCESGVEGINYTGRYENNQSYTNITASGTIDYRVFGYTNEKTIYPSITNQRNFQYCLSPTWINFGLDYDLNYEEFGSASSRSRGDSNVLVSSVVTNVPLYVLSEVDAGLIRIRVTDAYSNALSGVVVTATRDIAGIDYIVQSGVTDDSGLVYFNLDTTITYTISASKSGYSSASVSIQPTTTDIYTIELSTEASTAVVPSSGITYYFLPTSPYIVNDTEYDFQFNVTSSYWELQGCSLYLWNNGSLITSDAGSLTGTTLCGADITLNVGNYTLITAEGRYTINGSTYNITKNYYSSDYELGSYSLKVLLDDIKNLTGSGFNYQTKLLLTFIIIFTIIAVTSWRYNGLVNAEGLLYLQWGLVVFFSMIGWLTVEGIPFPVIWDGSINTGQYAIAFIDTLITLSYIIWRHN